LIKISNKIIIKIATILNENGFNSPYRFSSIKVAQEDPKPDTVQIYNDLSGKDQTKDIDRLSIDQIIAEIKANRIQIANPIVLKSVLDKFEIFVSKEQILRTISDEDFFTDPILDIVFAQEGLRHNVPVGLGYIMERANFSKEKKQIVQKLKDKFPDQIQHINTFFQEFNGVEKETNSANLLEQFKSILSQFEENEIRGIYEKFRTYLSLSQNKEKKEIVDYEGAKTDIDNSNEATDFESVKPYFATIAKNPGDIKTIDAVFSKINKASSDREIVERIFEKISGSDFSSLKEAVRGLLSQESHDIYNIVSSEPDKKGMGSNGLIKTLSDAMDQTEGFNSDNLLLEMASNAILPNNSNIQYFIIKRARNTDVVIALSSNKNICEEMKCLRCLSAVNGQLESAYITESNIKLSMNLIENYNKYLHPRMYEFLFNNSDKFGKNIQNNILSALGTVNVDLKEIKDKEFKEKIIKHQKASIQHYRKLSELFSIVNSPGLNTDLLEPILMRLNSPGFAEGLSKSKEILENNDKQTPDQQKELRYINGFDALAITSKIFKKTLLKVKGPSNRDLLNLAKSSYLPADVNIQKRIVWDKNTDMEVIKALSGNRNLLSELQFVRVLVSTVSGVEDEKMAEYRENMLDNDPATTKLYETLKQKMVKNRGLVQPLTAPPDKAKNLKVKPFRF
jgi:copper chaperone CopZ